MKHRSTNMARFALTAVALATACLWTAPASALGLGRLTVQSALGEALRAEVDVTSITPEELASIKMRVASPEAYRQAGIDYNAVLSTAEVKLEKRPDGRQVLRITSDRAVLEPFVDVILEADWATGRFEREYTMLFDPPGRRYAQQQAPAAAQTSPVISPAPAPSRMTTPAPLAQAPARPAPRPLASNGPRP
ncbi:MAG: hypothetical protein KGM91_21225, partial [Burkholderiales bacterium]|nr:hypothetical protein [Burkholderiales bacterium]